MLNEKTTIEDMKNVGAHLAVIRKRRHPSMVNYIKPASKNSKSMFDLEKVFEHFNEACKFITSLGKSNKTVLFITGRDEAMDLVRETAKSIKMPYITSRWIGGIISNFANTKKRITRMKKLEEEKESGKWERMFTKKEQILLDREYKKLVSKFDGIRDMESLPAAIFVLDTDKVKYAIKEARNVNIPVIGFVNANNNLSDSDYSIIANNNTVSSIKFVLDKVVEAYRKK